MKYLLVIFTLSLVLSCSKDSCENTATSNCICTFDYTPVCGCDNVTYGNACGAECNGITDYTQGACP